MHENYLPKYQHIPNIFRIFIIIFLIFSHLSFCKALPPGTYDVNTASELISAINNANNDRMNSVINLNFGFYDFFTDIGDARVFDGLALPVIESDNGSTLTINGNFQELGVFSSQLRFFYVESGASLTINQLTLTGGYPQPGAGGGAIYNEGNITLNMCKFINNITEDSNGGAISNEGGTVKIDQCYFYRNLADGLGTVRGAGVYQRTGTLNITNSTFEENSAGEGAGVFIENGTAVITNCTFYNNDNGGIDAELGNVRLTNCTIAFSSGSSGISNNGATFSLKNTIVSNNLFDASGTFLDLGHNIISNTFGSNGFTNATSLPDVDPLLESYFNDGGSTSVITLNSNSEAINNGVNESDVPKTDQRGYLRDNQPDIGAYESRAGIPVNFIYSSFVKQTGFRIEWQPSSFVDNYRIDVSTSSAFAAGSFINGYQNLAVNANTSFVDVNGLLDGTKYFFRVKIQKGSNISENDIIDSVRTLTSLIPSPTANPVLASSIGFNSFQASWKPVPGAQGYLVDVSTGPNFTSTEIFSEYFDFPVSGTATTLSVTGLDPGTTYFYRVRTVILDRVSLSSNVISVTTLDSPPAAPTNLQAVASGENSITLSWIDNSNNENSFEIERSRDNVTFDLINIVDANVIVYTDDFLDKSVNYYYRVRAVNSAGNSAYTPSVSIITLSTPLRPTQLEAFAASSNSIYLFWVDNSTNESLFQIERALDPAQGFVVIANVPADSTFFIDNAPVANRVNFYRVRALSNTQGNSDYSNIAGARAADIPSEPTNLVASTLSSSQIALNWTDNADNELGYRIEVANIVQTGDFFVEIAQVGPDITTYIDTNLIGNQLYTYRVIAYNDEGTSLFSNEAQAVTLAVEDISKPNTPSDLEAEPVTDSEILLRWSDNSADENTFIILRSEQANTGFVPIAEVGAGTTRYQDVGLTAGVIYYYYVQASNAAGESDLSNRAFAIPECNLTVAVSIDEENLISRICDDKGAFLLANTNSAEATYQWYRNDKPIPNANLNIYQAIENGEYNCRITSGFTCDKQASNPVVVILDELFTINLFFEEGALFASVVGAQTYQWYYDFEPISGANGDFFRPNQEGSYYVEVTSDGCTATSELFFYQITGTESQNLSGQMKLYPVPSPDIINLSLESNLIIGVYEINVYDTKGQKYSLDHGFLTQNKLDKKLNLSHLPSGIYVLEFKGEQATGRRKVIKY